MDNQYLSFAHEQSQLDWDNVLCSRFGVVHGLNVLVTATQSGLYNVSISDGLWREEEYVRMLRKIVLPYLTKNKDKIYVQESNEFTTSETALTWFAAHPNVKYVTWPPICGINPPMSSPWVNMRTYVKENMKLGHRRRVIVDFWNSLKETPNYFKDSFATTKGSIEKAKNEHIHFVRDHFQLDWNKTLFARFGEVRCVNVFVATTPSGPFNVSISDGLMSEMRYLQVLDDVILPFMAKNKGTIYVQESNDITKSSKVNSWFETHPEIRFITWPPIISPISKAWENMNNYVDANYPITGEEIKQMITVFFEKMNLGSPRYQIGSFNRLKVCFDVIGDASSD